MTMFIRRLLHLAFAFCAAIAVWSLMETALHLRSLFSDYLLYAAISGGVYGATWGLFIGALEGVFRGSARRFAAGSVLGALSAALGGVLGALVSQLLLSTIGGAIAVSGFGVERYVVPLTRAVGWAVLAAAAAGGRGLLTGSPRRFAVGALGGFLGGLAGGVAVEFARVLFPEYSWVHLVGMCLFALFVVALRELLERAFSFGVLRVLNGERRREEFPLDRRVMLVGVGSGADVPLPARSTGKGGNGTTVSCRIVARGNDLFLEPAEGSIRLNEERVEMSLETGSDGAQKSDARQRLLRYDDVVSFGGVKMLCRRA